MKTLIELQKEKMEAQRFPKNGRDVLKCFPIPDGFWEFVEEHKKKLDPRKSFTEDHFLQCLRLYYWLFEERDEREKREIFRENCYKFPPDELVVESSELVEVVAKLCLL